MTFLKRAVFALLLLLCLFLGLWITQDNPQSVAVSFLGFAMPELPLGLWLVISLAFGVVIGMLASLPALLRSSRRLRREQHSGAARHS